MNIVEITYIRINMFRKLLATDLVAVRRLGCPFLFISKQNILNVQCWFLSQGSPDMFCGTIHDMFYITFFLEWMLRNLVTSFVFSLRIVGRSMLV